LLKQRRFKHGVFLMDSLLYVCLDVLVCCSAHFLKIGLVFVFTAQKM
jgi:hypothetical protein